MSNNLHILGARIIPPVAVSEEDAARGVHERLHVVIEVENVGGVPLHVWSSRRAFDFNPATGVLRLDLAEPAEGQPPGMIKKISDHPRVPSQIIAAPREKPQLTCQSSDFGSGIYASPRRDRNRRLWRSRSRESARLSFVSSTPMYRSGASSERALGS